MKAVHLRQLATWTYQITPSWTPSSRTPEECDCSQCGPTPWTCSVSSTQLSLRFCPRFGRDSLPQIQWSRRSLWVSTTATSSSVDGNIPRRQCTNARLHSWAMGTRHSGLPLDELTKQWLLPICHAWRVQTWPVSDQAEGHEDGIWQRAEGRNHRSVLPKLQQRWCSPGDSGSHATSSGSRGVGTTHTRRYEMDPQSPTPYHVQVSRHHQELGMVDAAAILRQASYWHPSALF